VAARAAAAPKLRAREDALDALVDADAPRIAKMQAAGAPKSVAVRALALARAAVAAAGPSNGALYTKALKGQISVLSQKLVSANDRVEKLEKEVKTWREAAMAGEE
jgi:hypothetical protein